MNPRLRLARSILVMLLCIGVTAIAKQPPASAKRVATGGTIHQVSYAAGTKPGELTLPVDYYLWIPDGVKTLRGVIVHQHGCGPGASMGGRTAADDLHWQALARKWDCALMGSSYDPRKGVECRQWCDSRSDERFVRALDHFAQATGHAEVSRVPWCLWGHSGGGFWASLMHHKHPQRIVAIWLQSGTAYTRWVSGEIPPVEIPEAAYGVPIIGCPGLKEKTHERFKTAWNGTVAMRDAYVAKGAWFAFAPDPRTGHECGDSRYLAIPSFDFWLEHRLPAPGDDTQTLRPIDDAARAAWDKTMAPKLAEFIKTGAVSDTTPPPAPTNVKVRVESGNVVVTWDAEADFESGIRAFVIERDGKKIAQVPEKPVGKFGRPLFQKMSYHDTPEAPLPEMKYVDTTAPSGKASKYTVRTINSAGLRSEPRADH